MKDTRAGGGAIACKPMSINELRKAVSGLYAEPGFFAGEISPLLTRESTGSPNPLPAFTLFYLPHIRFQSNNDGL